MGLVGRRATLLLGSVALTLSMGTHGSLAQDADEQTQETAVNEEDKQGRVTRLDRLVVGAGVEKVAIDTPQAVTVVDQEDIDSIQPTVITDVVENTVGVNATGSSNILGQGFNIRGIGGSETAGGDEGRIITNIDGVNKFFEQYRIGAIFTDPELYKQVEILRGPASSTLYGSGALGGVINFTTKDASDFLGDEYNTVLRLKGGYETNSEAYLGSAIAAHRFNDYAEVLLMGNYRKTDNYTSGNGTEVLGNDGDAPSGLAKGTFTFGENMEQQLRISYQQSQSMQKDQEYNKIDGTSDDFGLLEERTVTDKTAIISYQNDASDNPWLDFNVLLSYSDIYVEQTHNNLATCSGGFFDLCPLFNSNFGYEEYQFTADNTFDKIGDNYENYLTIGHQTIYQTRTRDGSDSPSHAEGTDLQSGLFVQNEFIWDDRLTVIAGMRVDYSKLSPETNDVILPPGPPDKEYWGYSPKIAVLYKITDDFSVFGSVAHTERLPTLDEVYQLSGGSFQLNLDPEKSNSYEAGFAVSGYDLLSEGDSVQLKTTGFYNDITDYIEDFGRFAVPRFTNTGNVEIYGAEVEFAYSSDYFYSNAGYSYVRGFDKTNGGYLNTVAPHEFFITIGKTLPDQGLDFGWTSRFVAAQNEAGGTRMPSAAFDVHSAYLNWVPVEGPLVGWEGRVRVDNIFNEQYQEYLEGEAAEGRTFKFTLVKQFGWS